MFYNLIYPLHEHWSLLNLFQYLTVRAGGALLTTFFIWIFVGPWVISRFRGWQSGGITVKEVAHSKAGRNRKAGTPTMGGALSLFAITISGLLWADLSKPQVWLLLSVALGFGAIGLVDDYLALARLWRRGLPGPLRLMLQFILAGGAVFAAAHMYGGTDATAIYMPFFKAAVWDVGMAFFILFGAFVIVGAANAVNITDGLDGLVAIPAAIAAGAFVLLAYITGRADYTAYLDIAHIPGAGEVAVIMSALVGACLGFLWYNAPPARIFMGDTGALPIGAMLGTASVIVKQEFALAVIGGLFVLETVSVIVQVASFRLTGKRVFRMAPLHHHFEQKGWPETTIVVRFWVIAILLAMVGLATLKLR